jgi:hypothetical protein
MPAPQSSGAATKTKGVSLDVGCSLSSAKDDTPRKGNAMNEFIARYKEQLNGVLSGFDRLVFRGTLGLNHEAGLKGYLWANHLGLKDFGAHAERVSKQVKEASLAAMEGAGRPFRYLNSGKEGKQALAQQIAARDGIRSGPICALSAVELCCSYAVRGDAAAHKLRLERAFRKCLFIYHYWMHPVFGFMSARLQTWFPFPIHIYLNGRWLVRALISSALNLFMICRAKNLRPETRFCASKPLGTFEREVSR